MRPTVFPMAVRFRPITAGLRGAHAVKPPMNRVRFQFAAYHNFWRSGCLSASTRATRFSHSAKGCSSGTSDRHRDCFRPEVCCSLPTAIDVPRTQPRGVLRYFQTGETAGKKGDFSVAALAHSCQPRTRVGGRGEITRVRLPSRHRRSLPASGAARLACEIRPSTGRSAGSQRVLPR